MRGVSPRYSLSRETASANLRPEKLEAVASGEHLGLAWHVQRVTETGSVILTVSGFHDGRFSFRQLEMTSVTRGQVKATVEAHQARLASAAAKRSRRDQP